MKTLYELERRVFSAKRVGAVVGPALGIVAGMLTGCGTVATPATSPVTPPGSGGPIVTYTGVSFTVSVQAGTQGIAGGAVQLYAAGMTGNGSAGTSLVSAGMTTDASGTVVVPAAYNCPSAGAPVYLVARGGAVGTGGANANIGLMAALGPCGGVTAGMKAVVNEVTTVGAMYALAPFYGAGSNGGAVGASATNLVGLTNAFATAATLVNVATGTAPGVTLGANASSPAGRVNTVANALHGCVVSAAVCGTLYSATAPGGSGAGSTLEAAYAVAANPGRSIAGVYAAAQGSAAFQPALGSVPADWTMFVTYTGGGLNQPEGIGVDSTGSVWVANYFGTASKFSPGGAPVFAGGVTGFGLGQSFGLAIDGNDDAWITNETGSLTVLTPGGVSAAGAGGYTAGGLYYPKAVAIDPDQTVWVVDYANSHLTLMTEAGVPLSGAAGYTTPLFQFPVTVAVDGNHFGWVGNLGSTTVTRVSADGTSFKNFDCCNGASAIAMDQENNVWVTNFYGASVSMISGAGVVVSNQGYTGLGSVNGPQGIAVDGAGNVWVANFRGGSLTELAGATGVVVGASLSPAGGMGGDAGLVEAYGVAVDASGDVWVSNEGSNTVTKFIGLATPVKTPLLGLPKLP